MGKFELRPIYYPKASYLNYILEIWVDEVNISQFYEDNKLRIDVGYIFHIYNFFDDYLEDIMKEEVLPYEDVEGKTIFETIDNIKEKYFYWLKDDYGHDEDDESDEEIEKIISISEPFYEWQRAHRLLLSGSFLCIPDIIFRRIGDKIEISWDTTWDITYQQRKYENINSRQICAPLYDRLGAAQTGRIYPFKRHIGTAKHFDKISRTDHFAFEQIRAFAKRARTARRIQTCASAKPIHRRRNTAHHRRRFGAGELFGNRSERMLQTVNMRNPQIVGRS